MTLKQFLFGFAGRFDRMTYWIVHLAIGLFAVPFFFLPWFLSYPAMALTFWIAAATNAKRLHDINKSAWWQLFPIVNLILLIAFLSLGTYLVSIGYTLVAGAVLLLMVFPVLFGIWINIKMAFFQGDLASNRFGVPMLWNELPIFQDDEKDGYADESAQIAEQSLDPIEAVLRNREPTVSPRQSNFNRPTRTKQAGFGRRNGISTA